MTKATRYPYRKAVIAALGAIAACGSSAFTLFALPGYALMPHGMCFLWNPALLWSNAVADALIGIAYLTITALLVAFVARNKPAIAFHWTIIAFATFILACGAGHLLDVLVLWNPLYWLETGVKFVTVLASCLTAAMMPLALRRSAAIVRKARNAENYRAEAIRVNVELAKRRIERKEPFDSENRVLEERIAERTAQIDALNCELAAQLAKLESAYARLESDAVERERVALRLEYLAHHDPVTGLANRVRLMQRFVELIEAARRAGSGVLVVYLDLDRFKPVNDTFGHAVGDTVLAEIGKRIGRCVRTGDIASRVGGDEFVLLCATVDGAGDAPRLSQRLLRAVAEPIEIDQRKIVLGASIGISLFPPDSAKPDDLIMNADMAMYRAKQSGRNCYAMYSPEIDVQVDPRALRPV